MAKAIIMPKFGMTQEEATIIEWLVDEGTYVEKGDPILEVTTDKVNMEVEAPADGYLSGFRYQGGDIVPVTAVIAYILAEGETAPEADEPLVVSGHETTPANSNLPPLESAPADASPVARRMAAARGIDLADVEGSGPRGRINRTDVERLNTSGSAPPPNEIRADGKLRATPAARKIAREHGINLRVVKGRGPRGRVQGDDVLAAVESSVFVPDKRLVAAGEPLIIPLKGIRRTIAERMQASAQEAPHITFTLDIDMTKSIDLRKNANEQVLEGHPRISMTAVIVKAVAWTLRQHPMLNSYMREDEIVVLPDVNVGVAVALEDGLIVPVVRDANLKGLLQIGSEVADLSQRARESRLNPDDVDAGTFTVSNLGMFGVDHFTAIINPPQVAILAVGQISRRFVPDEDDGPVARPLMMVTLSADHRAIDGAQAARFVATLRSALEEPSTILL